MAEYTYNPVQTVTPNENVLLNNAIPCNRGYVLHRNESGIVTLRGIVNNPCSCFARYKVEFNGNIALAEGATVAPIAVAVAIDGEEFQVSRAIVTPAAVGDYFNVTCVLTVDVPRGCCNSISVENVAASTEAGYVIQPIDVQNATLSVTRTA